MPRGRFVSKTIFLTAVVAAVGGVAVIVDAALTAARAQEKKPSREVQVREDRKRVESEGKWIYDDLARGMDLAKTSGKPVVVVLRCIPCEACAKLDEDVVDRDPAVQALLDRFVCVRIPKANGLDLGLFQFDTDQSWCAFFLNADQTIYGRYGTRSHRTDAERDVSLAGFAKAMEGALALHADFANVKASLAAKRGPAPAVRTPEELPTLKGKYAAHLDWEGKVVQSCIHCHMVGEAERAVHRNAGKPIPETLLFPYPHPTVLGLTMDPKERARVKSVEAGSAAEKDGFRAGDDVVALEGQPILSVADLQWVLHHAPATAQLAAEVVRSGKKLLLPLTLGDGWRRRGDLSWRVSSWDLRRMVTGGLALEELPDADRRKAKIPDGAAALRVKHVGQYGAHAVAKKAGFLVDDVVVAVDGRTDLVTDTALLVSLATRTKPGDVVTFTVLRDGKRTEIALPMQ